MTYIDNLSQNGKIFVPRIDKVRLREKQSEVAKKYDKQIDGLELSVQEKKHY